MKMSTQKIKPVNCLDRFLLESEWREKFNYFIFFLTPTWSKIIYLRNPWCRPLMFPTPTFGASSINIFKYQNIKKLDFGSNDQFLFSNCVIWKYTIYFTSQLYNLPLINQWGKLVIISKNCYICYCSSRI